MAEDAAFFLIHRCWVGEARQDGGELMFVCLLHKTCFVVVIVGEQSCLAT